MMIALYLFVYLTIILLFTFPIFMIAMRTLYVYYDLRARGSSEPIEVLKVLIIPFSLGLLFYYAKRKQFGAFSVNEDYRKKRSATILLFKRGTVVMAMLLIVTALGMGVFWWIT